MSFEPYLQVFESLWWLWGTVGVGTSIVYVASIIKGIDVEKVEEGPVDPNDERPVKMVTAKEYLDGKAAELGKERQEELLRLEGASSGTIPSVSGDSLGARPEAPSTEPGVTGLAKVFNDALKEKIRATVLEADLNLKIEVPLLVEGNELKTNLTDGEIGTLVLKSRAKTSEKTETATTA